MISSQYFLLRPLMSCDVFHQLLQTVKQHISLLKDIIKILYTKKYTYQLDTELAVQFLSHKNVLECSSDIDLH